MDTLSAAEIQNNLPITMIGQEVMYFPRIDSTSARLKHLAEIGAAEGLVLVADEQLIGRGRFNRTWYAPAGSSLLSSILFRPDFLPPLKMLQVAMVCALAMADAVADETGVQVSLKWPNDLLVQGKKVAGLLAEAGFVGDRLEWVVVGLGLNVNLDFSAGDNPVLIDGILLTDVATSLHQAAGRLVLRLPLFKRYLLAVDHRYARLRGGESPYREWSARLSTLGQSVVVTGTDGVWYGVAESVAETGALLLRLADGQLKPILAGDVTLRGE